MAFYSYREKMEHSVVPGSRLLNHLSYDQEIDGIFQMTDYLYCEKEWKWCGCAKGLAKAEAYISFDG